MAPTKGFVAGLVLGGFLLSLGGCACGTTEVPDAGVPPASDGRGCACPVDEVCEGGACRRATCFDRPCAATDVCNGLSGACEPRPAGVEPVYVITRVVRGGGQQNVSGPFSGVQGELTHGVVHPSGRYFYLFSANFLERTQALYRLDFATGRADWFTGAPEPGFVDGPAQVAMLSHTTYNNGGYAFSPDASRLYYLHDAYGGAVRSIDPGSGEVRTLAAGRLGALTGGPDALRSLSVGRTSGAVYVTGFGTKLWTLDVDGGVTTHTLALPTNLPDGGVRSTVDYFAADEQRGRLFTLTRDGFFFSFALDGSDGQWLNSQGLSATPDRDQYLSDGPVERGVFFGPTFVTLGFDGKVYIGGGDSRTFRRYDPQTRELRSLCWSDRAAHRASWCLGDGLRNKLITPAAGFDEIFCHLITQDEAGNLYFAGEGGQVFVARRVE